MLETTFPPPPALSNYFVGRSDLVENILAYHESPLPSTSSGHWTTVLYGIGGIGKTQLATKIWQELHHRYANHQSWGSQYSSYTDTQIWSSFS
jgi:Cdc6-like AAA superfamily ATPase